MAFGILVPKFMRAFSKNRTKIGTGVPDVIVVIGGTVVPFDIGGTVVPDGTVVIWNKRSISHWVTSHGNVGSQRLCLLSGKPA